MTNPTNSEDVKAKGSGEKLYDEADKVWPRHREWADESPILKADYETLAARLDAKLLAAEQARDEALEALRPFAEAASASAVMVSRQGDSYELIQNGGPITFMDLRRAAKIINPQTGDA